jgi:dynein heavy chain 2
VSIAEVHCSSETHASQLAASLKQHCNIVNTSHGKVLRPKHGERLVMFLSDLPLPRADKYDTVCMVVVCYIVFVRVFLFVYMFMFFSFC